MATTTLGTTLADFADRSLGLGYPGGVAIVFTMLIASLAVWRVSEGSVAVQSVTTRKAEWFYWSTIRFPRRWGPRWEIGWPVPIAADSALAMSTER